MPGPGKRGKSSKTKKSNHARASGSNVPRDAYVDDVDHADGWTPIVILLCQYFELPDMTTRNGLKKIHANFDAVYKKLDSAYQQYIDNEKIRGGIVGIYAKMCVDSLLRNKLFEKGLLDKLIPLLNIESTTFLALRALTLVTQQGGAPIRVAIASHAPALVKLIDTYPSGDPLLHDLVVSILSHSIGTATEGDEGSPTYPRVLKQLDMPKILNTIIHCMTQPDADGSCINHGVELITSSTLQASLAYKKAPEAIKVLVAGMRAQDWGTRAMCLGALIRLNKLGSATDFAQLDPNRIIQIVQTRSTPDNLIDVMFEYGLQNCDMYMTMSVTKDFTNAIMKFPQDLNLYALGLKLAKCIVTTEFSIADGYYETMNERTGRREPLNMPGLPFQRYTDSLPLCATAIRERTTNPHELDAADVLDIKFKIMRQRVVEASDQARRALERSPNFAYFHYAMSLRADPVGGLRSAKQGMKCKTTTPFIKFQLMQRAVEHSAELGLQTLQKAHLAGELMDEGKAQEKLGLGVAFLQSALEDAKQFLAEAPPDNRHKKSVSYWCVLLTIAISETVRPDLSELKTTIDRLKIADDFGKLLGQGSPRTALRITQEMVRELYKESTQKYARLFEVAAEGKELPDMKAEKGKDDLAAWLDDLHLGCEDEGCGDHGHEHRHGHGAGPSGEADEAGGEPKAGSTKAKVKGKVSTFVTHPKISMNMVELYRCSHCGNPSAVLRKCSGCEKTRYCDSSCQKAHWSEHKKPCKAAQGK